MKGQSTGAIHRVQVTIYGESYALRGDAPPEHLEALAVEVDRRMRDIAQRNPRLGTLHVAVLAALQLADELKRLRQEQLQGGAGAEGS